MGARHLREARGKNNELFLSKLGVASQKSLFLKWIFKSKQFSLLGEGRDVLEKSLVSCLKVEERVGFPAHLLLIETYVIFQLKTFFTYS